MYITNSARTGVTEQTTLVDTGHLPLDIQPLLLPLLLLLPPAPSTASLPLLTGKNKAPAYDSHCCLHHGNDAPPPQGTPGVQRDGSLQHDADSHRAKGNGTADDVKHIGCEALGHL